MRAICTASGACRSIPPRSWRGPGRSTCTAARPLGEESPALAVPEENSALLFEKKDRVILVINYAGLEAEKLPEMFWRLYRVFAEDE